MEEGVVYKEIRFKVPAKVFEMLEELCRIDIQGELVVEFDKVNQLARECLYRGLAQVVKERTKPSVAQRVVGRQSGGSPEEKTYIKKEVER